MGALYSPLELREFGPPVTSPFASRAGQDGSVVQLGVRNAHPASPLRRRPVHVLSPTPHQVIRLEDRALRTTLRSTLAGSALMRVRANASGDILQEQAIELRPGCRETSLALGAQVLAHRGDWLRLEVLHDNKVLARTVFGRGFVFLTMGQSNTTNSHLALLSRAKRSLVSAQNLDGSRQLLRTTELGDIVPMAEDGLLATARRSSVWPYLGDRLADAFGLPTEFVNIGWTGSSIDRWNRFRAVIDDRYDHCGLRQRFDMLARGDFDAVLWHQGETDALLDTPTDEYEAKLRGLIAYSRQYLGYEVPWFVSITSREPPWPGVTTGYNPDGTDAHDERISQAQRNIRQDPTLANIYAGPNTDLIPHAAHFDTVEQLRAYRDSWFGALHDFAQRLVGDEP